jgi:putative PIN family toxin of toxin-antitoxin system
MKRGRNVLRVMTDTNIIVAALLFPSSAAARTFEKILDEHTLVLCTYIIEESRRVFERKFSAQLAGLQWFVAELGGEVFRTPHKVRPERYPRIRDAADLPILASAIEAGADLLITADQDFFAVAICIPRIVSPYQFLTM